MPGGVLPGGGAVFAIVGGGTVRDGGTGFGFRGQRKIAVATTAITSVKRIDRRPFRVVRGFWRAERGRLMMCKLYGRA